MNANHARTWRVPAAIPAGALATCTMDFAMVTAGEIGGAAFTSERLSPQVIGRWAAGLLHGRWRHADITTEPVRQGELALGIATHYATGIALTQAFLLLPRRADRKAGFLWATGFGIATAVLPLMVLFPSLGYGCLGLRSGEAARLNRTMLVGHAAFGIGIGLWSLFFARRRRGRPIEP
jgi:hypothetical protein